MIILDLHTYIVLHRPKAYTNGIPKKIVAGAGGILADNISGEGDADNLCEGHTEATDAINRDAPLVTGCDRLKKLSYQLSMSRQISGLLDSRASRAAGKIGIECNLERQQ